MKLLDRRSIGFQFAGLGEQITCSTQGENRLHLDVGNQLQPGVIDHHHLAAYQGSAASLVLAHPELILASVNSLREDIPFTIMLHKNPDLDCLASAYLSISYLTSGSFPEGGESLARYADSVDGGYLGMSCSNPFALYSACMDLAHRLSLCIWNSQDDMWRRFVGDALDVVDFVVRKVAREGVSVLDVDAFLCPGLFRPQDRDEVKDDIVHYRRKLSDPKSNARRLFLRLPRQLGGTAEVEAILVRDVQHPQDPERCMFFRDWARSDSALCPGAGGFVALSVFESESSVNPRRCIISVKPDSGVWLRGLGALLDHAEAEERRKIHTVDDRAMDPTTRQPKLPRRGYSNSDPWYDGRAHSYTIVDSPRAGTVLTAERIEEIFIGFGRSQKSVSEPLKLVSLDERLGSLESDEDALKLLSSLAREGQRGRGPELQTLRPDIFLSYPSKRLAWVQEHIYKPLTRKYHQDKIFFDKDWLKGGDAWLPKLATAVDACRVFIPIYCPEYFDSRFCQWELQLAFTRDPTGAQNIIGPIEVAPVERPSFCRLIQAIAGGKEFMGSLLDVLGRILK